MKNIDFSKPLRGKRFHQPATVVQEGVTVLNHCGDEWVVDETGQALGYLQRMAGVFENVPEVKDHIVLRKSLYAPYEYIVCTFSGEQLVTEKEAKSMLSGSDTYNRYTIVKVPV